MAVLIFIIMAFTETTASTANEEMALANITRFATGDFFTIIGTDCGPTRCMEVSRGTALAALGGGEGCVCQCHVDTPAFREDQHVCVDHIDECAMASFGRGATKPQIPFVFLPLKGQIIYPSKEIIFTDVNDARCSVTSAQYLSPSGWVTLRDRVDYDVPFGVYRDEGSTFLQWRGSASLHARLEGHLIAAHVLCSTSAPTNLAASCAAFRVAGTSHNGLLDVRTIRFQDGETVTTEPTTQSQGLSVLESLAIGVCVLMLIFVYAAGIIFYVHYKKRQRRKEKDPEMNLSNTLSTDNGSPIDSRIGVDSMRMKTNPLLKIETIGNDFLQDAGLSDVSEHTEDTIDSSPNNTQKFQKINSNVTAAMVHTHRKKLIKPSIRAPLNPERMIERLQRRSASPDTLERAPQSDLSIVDCSVENNSCLNQSPMSSNGEPALRRKLYFNPVFFETEHLKNPPPAAIEFLVKIREVMSIAKEKMTSKKFIPMLSDIPEEELYHTIDLGWDIPCAKRGRRFSAISLKRENSRRAIHCGGCPGCDSNIRDQKSAVLGRSNSCKTCVSEDYKQKIVRKWLNDVPIPSSVVKPIKSVAKVSGTPRIVEPRRNEEVLLNPVEPVRNEETKTLKITESLGMENISDIEITENRTNQGEVKFNSTSYNNNTIDDTTTVQSNSFRHTTRRIRKKLPPPPPPPSLAPPGPPTKVEEVEPIPPEVKKKMEAVIRELNECRRVEPKQIERTTNNISEFITPKIIIPVTAADSNYHSDDNMLSDSKKREKYLQQEQFIEFDSLERNVFKRRRFSLACGSELTQKEEEILYNPNIQIARERLSRSWRDVRKAIDGYQFISQTKSFHSEFENRSLPVSEIFINAIEPVYNNIPRPGPLTIEVRGSPVEERPNVNEDFDPDTLDRKPKREAKKRVDKILLKSGGSFKNKSQSSENETRKSPTEPVFTRKIGSLRQIYEAKNKFHDDDVRMAYNERRGSLPYGSEEIAAYVKSGKTPDLLRNTEIQKPPIPYKQRRGSDSSTIFSGLNRECLPDVKRRSPEERDRFPLNSRPDNLNARRSGRRSARTRSRRTDLRKLHKTEDSGYLSTDSNESKRRARYLMQMRQKSIQIENIPMSLATPVVKTPPMLLESDTDDLESLCDGRSESGGESVETDSVFFGNVDDSKQMFAELGLNSFEVQNKRVRTQEQIDSGFMGETNIILSGDSDSEHKSVISIIAGRDGRASAASIAKVDDSSYRRSVEC